MPLIRCTKCGQAYDVPDSIAVHLPNAIATCVCGEWLAGSKAAVLARLLNPEEIKEIDLKPYKVDAAAAQTPAPAPKVPLVAPGKPRAVRVIARSGGKSINRVFAPDKAIVMARLDDMVDLPSLGTALVMRYVFGRGPS